MKHNPNNRRPRSRGGKQRHSGGGGRNNYDSSGPDGKVRGSAQQVLDKYLSLAQDAYSAGDRIAAESFYQFAEHYYRVLNADGANNNQARRDRPQSDNPAPGHENSTPENSSPENSARENSSNEVPAASRSAAPANETPSPVDVPATVDPADQPQPDIADIIPPAIEVGGGEPEAAPKPRRRRSRAKTEEPAEAPETVQAS